MYEEIYHGMTLNEENSGKTGHVLEDPNVSAGLRSRSIRSVRRGETRLKGYLRSVPQRH